MNNNLHIDTLLDDLLKKNITESEAFAMLKKENIIDTVSEIDLHFAAAKALQRYNVLKQVQLVHKDYADNSNRTAADVNNFSKKPGVLKMLPLKLITGIAASVILLIGGWFIFQYINTGSGKLYAEMYQPYNINTDRGVGVITTHNMVEEFKRKDYRTVIRTYESLSASNNREKFLAAYAYHESINYPEAINLLQQILAFNRETKTKLYNDEAEFYLGLSYLKIKDAKSAIPFFEAIQKNPNHTFHERVSRWTLTKLKWLK